MSLSPVTAQIADIIEMVDMPQSHPMALPVVMYSEKPSPELVLEMHEDDVPAQSHEEIQTEPMEGAIEIHVDDLPGVEALDPDLEQSLDVHDDSVSSNDTLRAVDNNDAKKSKKESKWDWEACLAEDGCDGFVAWIKERLEAVPKHSGYDTSGIERAISYMDRLDNEISKAMRLDLDGHLDADKVEEIRAKIDDGIERLHARLDKVKSKKGKKKKSSAQEDFALVKEAQKSPHVGGVIVTVPLLISRLARVIINGMVSAGHDCEVTFQDQCKKYDLNTREQAELMQLLADMGMPLRQDRGYLLDEDVNMEDGRFDWGSNYQA